MFLLVPQLPIFLQIFKDSGAGNWWRAEVVDTDEDSHDKDNPDFFVTYTYEEN